MFEMREYIHIAKSLVRGAMAGLGVYIKPGGLHRLSPTRVFDEISCNLVSSLDHIIEAVKLGDMIKRGEISATGVDYGKIFASMMRDVYRECNACHPQYIVPLSVIGLSIGLSEVESILQESSRFKKALETVNAVSKWSDLRQFIEILRVVGREDMYDHLQSVGYTQIALLKSGISFNDVFHALSSRWRGFSIIDSRESTIFGYLKRLIDLVKEYRSFEPALLSFYMELVKPHIPSSLQDKVKSIEQCRYSSTTECIKHMYELDAALRKTGYSFEWASEIVVLISGVLVFET